MSHRVLVLDNSKQNAKAMANAVQTADRDAVIDVVHTTKDAIAKVRGHASEFRYAIVDLVLDISPGSEQLDYTRGTNAFLDWLRGENLLASIHVLVLSQSTSILNNLDSGIAGRVKTYERSKGAHEESVAIKRFIEGL